MPRTTRSSTKKANKSKKQAPVPPKSLNRKVANTRPPSAVVASSDDKGKKDDGDGDGPAPPTADPGLPPLLSDIDSLYSIDWDEDEDDDTAAEIAAVAADSDVGVVDATTGTTTTAIAATAAGESAAVSDATPTTNLSHLLALLAPATSALSSLSAQLEAALRAVESGEATPVDVVDEVLHGRKTETATEDKQGVESKGKGKEMKDKSGKNGKVQEGGDAAKAGERGKVEASAPKPEDMREEDRIPEKFGERRAEGKELEDDDLEGFEIDWGI
ncbi:Galactosyl transferase [Macrophomina phaseolina MS6]|uniref:Galactosyl transferase n=1 Tax=Macrophomina phaseolina (strain MS6) TaxID=1126212 RepID=K2RHY8_MACPH|nr:Galactosyl transferase [Macrophomina phaseolina MS6]